MLDGQATDVLEGSSLSFQSEYIDIYSNCWGPKDDGKTFGKPGKLAQEALMQGALKVKAVAEDDFHASDDIVFIMFSPSSETRKKPTGKKCSRKILGTRRSFSSPGYRAAIFFSRVSVPSRSTD